MTRFTPRLIAPGLALMTLLPMSSPAQIGGAIRRVAKDVTQPPSQGQPVNVPPEYRITADMLDRLDRGLTAEESSRQESARQLAAGKARAKSPAEYQQCAQGFMLSPEMQQVTQGYQTALGRAGTNVAAIQKAGEDYQNAMITNLEKKCGPDPSRADPNTNDLADKARKAALTASGLTSAQYAMLKERVVPFCALPSAKRASGDVRAEGSYVFLASEATVLNPRCAALAPKIRADG